MGGGGIKAVKKGYIEKVMGGYLDQVRDEDGGLVQIGRGKATGDPTK